MERIALIATQNKRKDTLKMTVESLQDQVDQIIIYNNDEELTDYTDNAKFYWLYQLPTPSYIFLCDDDLIYPSNYIEKSIIFIERYGCIISWHGRVLQGLGKHYYRDHLMFPCLDTVLFEDGEVIKIDVCGTGVTCFRNDYFNPTDIYKADEKRMADLVFSLQASKEGKTIGLPEHEKGWIKDALPEDGGVFKYWQGKLHTDQNRLADQIYKLNYESKS